MRRTLATAVAALVIGLPFLPSVALAPALAGGPVQAPQVPTVVGAAPATPEAEADQALAQASELAEPAPLAQREEDRVEASLVLRDLFVARDDLSGRDREQADALLARPTDGVADPQGFGYTTSSRKKCSRLICVHYVTSTSDRVPNMAWVNKTLRVMKQVWKLEVKTLGYRKPLGDGSIPGNNGGNGKFDVYLKDVGSSGLYGFCAPEYRRANQPWLANGYCVLDNDFAREQFGTDPTKTLKVTAAHEFFHAVQFAYDYGEDRWFMESTATWMEERYADGVNDNRQYLPAGQLRKPGVPLDTFERGEGYQYGNWLWWEYLSARQGRGVVKSVWNRAGAFRGAPNQYSTQALRAVLRPLGGFPDTFARYASGNTMPARTYPEGAAYSPAPAAKSWRLGKQKRSGSATRTVDHMASTNLVAKPEKNLQDSRWRLRVRVDGPGGGSSPGVRVVARTTKGAWVQKSVSLSTKGVGKVSVPFSAGRVRSVTITLANASTRFRCQQGESYSCEGTPRDDGKRFQVKLDVLR